MDALALLCNLYGDGPSTLKRLRAHGVRRIEDLAERTPGELAPVLALAAPVARRFLKEAAALERRVLVRAEEPARKPARARREAPAERKAKQRALADAARRWSELDTAVPSARERAGARGRSLPESVPADARVGEPEAGREPATEPGPPLAAVGLDAATQSALRAAGVLDLEQLARAESEPLAAAAELGLSQVLFAQGLARRALREAPERGAPALREFVLAPGGRGDARFSPSELPSAGFLAADAGARNVACNSPDEGAGPFA